MKDIYYICQKCGIKHCNGPQFAVSTWSEGVCDICGNTRPLTEVRDFGYLKPDFGKRKRAKRGELVRFTEKHFLSGQIGLCLGKKYSKSKKHRNGYVQVFAPTYNKIISYQNPNEVEILDA